MVVLRVTRHGALYIQVEIATERGQKCLKRWPWPNDRVGREKHLRHARQYANELCWVLGIPVVDEFLGVQDGTIKKPQAQINKCA